MAPGEMSLGDDDVATEGNVASNCLSKGNFALMKNLQR